MYKKVIIPTILFIAVFAFSFFALSGEGSKNKPTTNEPTGQQNQAVSQIILFYGDGCPHCKIVEEYIEKNKTKEKLSFAQKEVYYNKTNANELVEKAKICGLPTDSIGVPFLFDEKKCYIGDQDIINFFKQKTNE
jgi:glutaredoxin